MQLFSVSWCFVIILLLSWIQASSGTTFVNVALGKPTRQSSIFGDRESGLAVDGNRQSDFTKGSCTHTISGTAQWWVVDLLSSYRIHSIAITNRDEHFNRLQGFQVWVSNKNPIPLLSSRGFIGQRCINFPGLFTQSGPHTMLCEKVMTGRYVYLWKESNQPLTLCEFEVIAIKETLESRGKHFHISSGIRLNENPFYSTTVRMGSILDCLMVCVLAQGGMATVIQLEIDSGTCECIQISGFVIGTSDWLNNTGWNVILQ